MRKKREPRVVDDVVFAIPVVETLSCKQEIGWCEEVGVTDLADSAAALVALVALSPVFAIAALLVKATSRGPVFFTQTRVGLNGRTFALYKFRSMHRDAEARRAAPRSGSRCASTSPASSPGRSASTCRSSCAPSPWC